MELKYSNEEISIKKSFKFWDENKRDTVVYIHNPFCMTQKNCHYCMHKGCPKENHSDEEVDKFYFEYMPLLFKAYSKIIKSQNIKLIDFGGGTPNYLSAEKFDKFCKSLPEEFKDVHKVIELHPALITEEFIDVLKKYNFTTLIFCFQTFDTQILVKQGRFVPNYSNSLKCVRYAKSLGLNVACDLITYWTTKDGWWNVLRKDLQSLKEYDMDEITISVLYQNKYNRDDFNGVSVYRHINEAVMEFYPNYENPEGTLNFDFNVAATRIYKPGSKIREDFDIYLNSLSDIPWEHEQGYSTLGIGTYKNGDKAAYSIIGPDILLYEEFKGFNKEPILHIHRNHNFWEKAINTIKYLAEQYNNANPPVGSSVILTNICQSKNFKEEQFAQYEDSGLIKNTIQNRLVFSGKSKEEIRFENEFIDKKKK